MLSGGGAAAPLHRIDSAGSRRASALSCAVDSVSDETWDRIVGDFADAHHEPTSYFSAKAWNGRGSKLLLLDGDRPVAGARVAIFALPGFKSGLAHLKFGPFWRRRDRAPDAEVYRAAIAALVEEFCVRRGHCLTIMPRPHPEFYPIECQVLAERQFAVRRAVSDPNRYLVDLSLGEDEQIRSLDQKWRYNLRRAMAENLDIRLCDSERDGETFRALHRSMVARKNFPGPKADHLLAADGADVPATLRPQLIMGFRNGQPIVGAVVGLFGDSASYMLGASAPEALALNAGYALQWWIVRWLSGQGGVRWYDLGGEAGERGLRQVKKGLAGKNGAVVAMRGEHDCWANPSGRIAADLIYAVRAAQRAVRWR